MAWAVNLKRPLILLPNLAALPYNWSHESAWAGNDWLAETGTPARDSTHALFGAQGAKFTGGASQVMLDRFSYSSATWLAVDAGVYSCYAWVYPTAYTGAAAVRMQLNLTKAGGVALTTPSQTIADYPISSLILNQWNLVRVAAPALSSSQQSEFVSVDYRVALVPNAGTATFWVDGCWFGRAFDYQDLGPYSTGAGAHAPFDYQADMFALMDRGPCGTFLGRSPTAGLNSGTILSTPVTPAGFASWEAFYDYLAAGAAVTLLHSQADQTRDFFIKAQVESDDTGHDPVNGMDTARIKLHWREVA